MHLAASGGHFELMQFLHSKGGSVEDEDKVLQVCDDDYYDGYDDDYNTKLVFKMPYSLLYSRSKLE